MNESTMRATLFIKPGYNAIDEIGLIPGHKYYLPENKTKFKVNETLEHAGYDGLNFKWGPAGLLTGYDKVAICNGKSAIILSP